MLQHWEFFHKVRTMPIDIVEAQSAEESAIVTRLPKRLFESILTRVATNFCKDMSSESVGRFFKVLSATESKTLSVGSNCTAMTADARASFCTQFV